MDFSYKAPQYCDKNSIVIAVMHYTNLFLLLSFILTCIYVFTTQLLRWRLGDITRLPPGPRPIPIIGNIFELGEKPHQSLAALSKTYGPLMSLKLGSITTIVVSSPKIAKDFFQKHDQYFSSRSVPATGQVVDHDTFSIIWLPVGDQWRKLRRISKEHLFSVQQLDKSQLLRRKKIQELLDYVHQCCIDGNAVNIGAAAFTTSLNVLSNFIFSMDMARYDPLSSQEFKDSVLAWTEIIGKPNLADFFPILKPFDPQGLRRKANIYAVKLLAILDRIVNQRVQLRANSSAGASSMSNDVLDLMLDLSQTNESEFSRNDIRHLLLDLYAAGTDTTTGTLEWAMAELIRNPEKMAKARSELEEIIGKDGRIVEESDISRLPYLQAVIRESFRLHPPTPLLVPHKALCDVEIQGFIVPKNAQIMCNVWAAGRDPNVWSNPQLFMPERFLDCNIDYKGRDFELIPFGAGRRICPGLPLAHRMLHVILGSLIHKFEWKLEGDMKAEDMDMSERFGITLPKNVPLMAIPVKV